MKTLILVVALLSSFSVSAMRCGTHLINEGDSVTRMIQLCGTPDQNSYSDVIYLNKDGDGINYLIHVDGAGMIDSISFSR